MAIRPITKVKDTALESRAGKSLQDYFKKGYLRLKNVDVNNCAVDAFEKGDSPKSAIVKDGDFLAKVRAEMDAFYEGIDRLLDK